MKILVIGANLCNRGAESMLLTLISQIELAVPDASFSVWSYSRDDKKKAGPIVHSEPNGIHVSFDLFCNHKTFASLFLQGLLSVVPLRSVCLVAAKLSPFIRSVGEADAVIDISGFALAGDRPWWRHMIYLLEARTAHACGTPFLAMTQSFGPFETYWQGFVAKRALAHAEFISARGPMSAEHLDSIGLTNGRDYVVAPDITYHFHPAPTRYAHEYLREGQGPRIAVIPNTNVYHRSASQSSDDVRNNDYVVALTGLCRQAIEKYGCHLIFIPHESYSSRFDDFSLVEAIRSDPRIATHSTVLGRPLPASVIKSVILECDGVITSRYHGMLAAFSCCIPAFVLGWADKYRESADMAGTPEFTFNFDQIELDSISKHFTRFWETRETTRRTLLERLQQNQLDSKRAIDTLVDRIRQHCKQ